jgi:hypothetical protein
MRMDFEELMTQKSDVELIEYLSDIDRYMSGAIIAAVKELKKRGQKFTDDELNDIKEKIAKKIETEEEEDISWNSNSWKKKVVTDQNAPLLYSHGVILAFSTIFTVIFGAVLLSINISDKKKKLTLIGFGILYTTLVIIISNLIPQISLLTIAMNAGGGFILTSTFWNKYVGKETKYRTKSIWAPLIISIVITIPFLLALIYW